MPRGKDTPRIEIYNSKSFIEKKRREYICRLFKGGESMKTLGIVFHRHGWPVDVEKIIREDLDRRK